MAAAAVPETARDEVDALDAPGTVKELRVAVVLYGGVSLAIYMHGTTRELHQLVRASASVDEAGVTPSPSEQVYRDLLRVKARAEGVHTRVVVDVIAGTSAGGINGVYLAKALAHDLDQGALRDLWFEKGDVGAIMRGWRLVPWQARLPWILATLWRRPALDGGRMTVWLFDALRAMDPPPDRPARSLMPDGAVLHLFVTLTDYAGYAREVTLGDPRVVYDLRHRHVMEFRHGDGDDDFAPAPLGNAALAFAARATSCFPGAFPPADFRSFADLLHRRRGVSVDLGTLERNRMFRQYALSGASAVGASFIDGGVLDNRPFGHAIAAVRGKPAAVEVDRRLVYLEPSPTDPRRRSSERRPGPIATVLASASGIPRNEPILDDILEVAALNERVRQIRDVIETNWSPVTDAVEDTLRGEDLADPPADPDDARLAAWRDRIHERAIDEAGFSYVTYVRAKIGDVVDTWARMVCRLQRYPDDSSHAAFVRAALRVWAERADLFQKSSIEPTQEQIDFLRDLDLGYGQRRLRFVIAGLSWWYDPSSEPGFAVPERAELDEGKRRLEAAAQELRAAQRGEGFPADLAHELGTGFGDLALDQFLFRGPSGLDAFLDPARSGTLSEIAGMFRQHLRERFTGFTARVYSDLHDLIDGWHPEARRRLMVRYLGFPFWDALVFPLQAVAGIGERDHVEVVRSSPRDATLLRPPDRRAAKLVGVRRHNFGAFFDRAGREGDYLWGRLDGAERLVTLLLGAEHPERERWCHAAFAAILDEEEQGLGNARDLVAHLRGQLGGADEPRRVDASAPSAGGS